MDGISPIDYALRLMRIKASTESFHMLSYQERSINRSQAMEKLQPMLDKLDQSTTSTADFVASAEASFTQESFNVFPQHAKIIIRLAAEVAGNNRLLDWIAAAKEDREEYVWMETIETPIPPADISRELVEDLGILVEGAPSDIQDLLQSRAELAKRLFKSFEQRILELTAVSEANAATTQQLREELCSTTKLLEQQQARERTRKAIEDAGSEYVPSEDEESEEESEDEAYASRKRRRLDLECKSSEKASGEALFKPRVENELRRDDAARDLKACVSASWIWRDIYILVNRAEE